MKKEIIKLPHEILKSRRPTIEELKTMKKFPITVVLDNIRSLHNVGSMFRTSDGAFIEKLYLCGYTGYPPRKEIDKTALGSVESVEWEHDQNTVEVLKSLKSMGYKIVALEHTEISKQYNKYNYEFPLCLVVGNEVEGISDEVLEVCDDAVEIPMYGIKQSLNVAVSYGIMIYHIIDLYLAQ